MKRVLIEIFQNYFKTSPKYFIRSPGRVNLIGEHTDYNEGFVLPMAIDAEISMVLLPRQDDLVRIYSSDFEEEQIFSLSNILKTKNNNWIEYIKGIAWIMQKHFGGVFNGFDAVLKGTVPKGAGLSSSAALEIAAAKAFSMISNLPWQQEEIAKLAQQAENQWVGVNCGIMDQMVIASACKKHALLIDCQNLALQRVLLPPETTVVIMDTVTRRGLVDSAYNERRLQCEEAAKILGVKNLRVVTEELWLKKQTNLKGKHLQRSRHVITENNRVLEAAQAMQQGDAKKMGQLMNASHLSLRDDFEVSSEHLNAIVSCAQKAPGCYGARMTGAGFGGCAVALVAKNKVQEFENFVSTAYYQQTEKQPSLYATKAAECVSAEEL